MDREERLKWRMGAVFMSANAFILVFAAAAIIILGIWTGLFVASIGAVLAIYISYRIFLIKNQEIEQ